MTALVDHHDLDAAIVATGGRRKALWDAIAEHRKAKMLPAVNGWREALAADGWSLRPTYDGHEPLEHAWSATRDGFRISGLARPIPGRDGSKPKPDLNAWGPDGAAIDLPVEYNFDAIKASLLRCGECGKEPVETKRYAFANRCCADCAPKFMASLPRNWAD